MPEILCDSGNTQIPERICRQGLYLLALGCLAWLSMQIVHEAGHVLGAAASHGQVVQLDLHPLRISQTIVRPNPHPRIEVWAGPVFGCLFPVSLWAVLRLRRSQWEPEWRFFTGFCLIANGAYLASGVTMPVGDAFDLQQLGTPDWQLGLFGILTIPPGLCCWNGLSGPLGLAGDARPVRWSRIATLWSLLLGIVILELILGSDPPGMEHGSQRLDSAAKATSIALSDSAAFR